MNRPPLPRLGCVAWLGLLLALGAASPAARAADDLFRNVRGFGAAGDGQKLDSPAIDKAIQSAADAGGGTVVIPAGKYLCGSIHLRSNVHLLLDAGATIVGAPQAMNAYDETEPWANNPYQDGGHCYFHNSLIWGENLTNVSITGRGVINGGGLVPWDDLLDRMCGFTDWGKQRPAAPTPDLPPSRLGNKAIALKLCRNVLIRDVTIVHGGHFAILATGCDNLTLDNITADTNRDGMDIDCCRNVAVSNCRINSPIDDGICPKSTYALGRNVLTENLTIVNCQVSGFEEGTLLDGTMKPHPGGTGRIKFGTESSGGFRNCTVSNCTFRSCRGLALEEVDGGTMENITIDNLAMTDVWSYAIYIVAGTRHRGGDVQHRSVCRNILISHVVADHVAKASGIQIMGTAEQPLEGIRLEDIRLISNGGGTREDAGKDPLELARGYPEPGAMPAYGIFARHVRDLELANIRASFLKDDLRPAASFVDIDGLEIDGLKAQTAPDGLEAVRTQDVRDFSIRNSPARR